MTTGAAAEPPAVGWAILGTANIARAAFVPALRRAGGGSVVAIGTRDPERGRQFAAREAPGARVGTYAEALADEAVRAVYVPLPNHLHREWAIRALEAGRAVLCEKPLGTTVDEVEAIIAAAGRTKGLLWEAFVFSFHPQTDRLRALVAEGAIGDPREILAGFHFRVRSPENIRWSAACRGGALNDVGCYPIHLARLLFDAEPETAWAVRRHDGHEVEAELQGMVRFPGGRRLLFTCGLERAYDAEARVLGTEGAVRLSNPYHPDAADVVELQRGSVLTRERVGGDQPSFTPAIRHVHAVLAGEAAPAHGAAQDALGTARAMEMVRSAAARGD